MIAPSLSNITEQDYLLRPRTLGYIRFLWYGDLAQKGMEEFVEHTLEFKKKILIRGAKDRIELQKKYYKPISHPRRIKAIRTNTWKI